MDVFIDIFLGPSYRIIKVDKEASVYDINEKIKEILGIPIFKQSLFLKDLEGKFLLLRYYHDVKNLKIVNNSRLHLFFPIRGPTKKDSSQIEEFLYGPKYRNLTIQASPTSKQDLTTMLFGDFSFDKGGLFSSEDLTNIRRALIAKVAPHQDQRTKNQDLMLSEMIIKISMPFNLEISKIEVPVNASDNVAELWKAVQFISQKKFRLNLSIDECVLTHKEKILEDDKSFAWNGVSQGDTIKIIHERKSVTQGESSTQTQGESSTQGDQA